MEAEIYLGDGVYAGNDGYQIWIWTSDGINNSDTIALDRETFGNLADYAERFFLK